MPAPAVARTAPRLAVPMKETDMQDMFGLAMLFELSQKNHRRCRREFDHLSRKPSLAARLRRLLGVFRTQK